MKALKQTGIWIDSSKAILVSLQDGEEKIKEVESDLENRLYHDKEGDKGSFMGKQHINNEKTFQERRKHQMQKFLETVLTETQKDDELYVFGPSGTKTLLAKMMEDEYHSTEKLKAIESADKMSINEIVAKVKRFYLH